MREQPARVLVNQPLKAAREVFKWERAGSAQRLHRPKADHSTAPALDEPGPDLPGLYWYCPMKGKSARVCADMPVPLTGSAPLGRFPWA